jgi:hypothetical protein
MGEGTNLIGKKEPEEIHGEIDKTRTEMGKTIDEIKEKFTPENIKERVKNRIQEKTMEMFQTADGETKEWGSGSAETITEGISGS